MAKSQRKKKKQGKRKTQHPDRVTYSDFEDMYALEHGHTTDRPALLSSVPFGPDSMPRMRHVLQRHQTYRFVDAELEWKPASTVLVQGRLAVVLDRNLEDADMIADNPLDYIETSRPAFSFQVAEHRRYRVPRAILEGVIGNGEFRVEMGQRLMRYPCQLRVLQASGIETPADLEHDGDLGQLGYLVVHWKVTGINRAPIPAYHLPGTGITNYNPAQGGVTTQPSALLKHMEWNKETRTVASVHGPTSTEYIVPVLVDLTFSEMTAIWGDVSNWPQPAPSANLVSSQTTSHGDNAKLTIAIDRVHVSAASRMGHLWQNTVDWLEDNGYPGGGELEDFMFSVADGVVADGVNDLTNGEPSVNSTTSSSWTGALNTLALILFEGASLLFLRSEATKEKRMNNFLVRELEKLANSSLDQADDARAVLDSYFATVAQAGEDAQVLLAYWVVCQQPNPHLGNDHNNFLLNLRETRLRNHTAQIDSVVGVDPAGREMYYPGLDHPVEASGSLGHIARSAPSSYRTDRAALLADLSRPQPLNVTTLPCYLMYATGTSGNDAAIAVPFRNDVVGWSQSFGRSTFPGPPIEGRPSDEILDLSADTYSASFEGVTLGVMTDANKIVYEGDDTKPTLSTSVWSNINVWETAGFTPCQSQRVIIKTLLPYEDNDFFVGVSGLSRGDSGSTTLTRLYASDLSADTTTSNGSWLVLMGTITVQEHYVVHESTPGFHRRVRRYQNARFQKPASRDSTIKKCSCTSSSRT